MQRKFGKKSLGITHIFSILLHNYLYVVSDLDEKYYILCRHFLGKNETLAVDGKEFDTSLCDPRGNL